MLLCVKWILRLERYNKIFHRFHKQSASMVLTPFFIHHIAFASLSVLQLVVIRTRDSRNASLSTSPSVSDELLCILRRSYPLHQLNLSNFVYFCYDSEGGSTVEANGNCTKGRVTISLSSWIRQTKWQEERKPRRGRIEYFRHGDAKVFESRITRC